jgi:hypothetical protein
MADPQRQQRVPHRLMVISGLAVYAVLAERSGHYLLIVKCNLLGLHA